MPLDLKIIKTIQSTDRFDAYEAEFEGQKIFAKKAKADKPAQLLACVPRNSKVDNELVDDKGFRQIFIKTGLANRMQERLPDNLSAGQKSTLAEAKKLFDKIHGSLVPALQDADIKPDHVFKDPKKQD